MNSVQHLGLFGRFLLGIKMCSFGLQAKNISICKTDKWKYLFSCCVVWYALTTSSPMRKAQAFAPSLHLIPNLFQGTARQIGILLQEPGTPTLASCQATFGCTHYGFYEKIVPLLTCWKTYLHILKTILQWQVRLKALSISFFKWNHTTKIERKKQYNSREIYIFANKKNIIILVLCHRIAQWFGLAWPGAHCTGLLTGLNPAFTHFIPDNPLSNKSLWKCKK